MRKIKKILIANRGEIASRIIRTIREMNLTSVAVYSEADRFSPHVRLADQAVCLGEAASSKSYLDMDKIIRVCFDLGIDAIHPGYGFLSENAAFAAMVRKNGIIFIGPEAHAIEMMGSKLAAKQAVAHYDVPLIPGTDYPIEDAAEAKKIAADIGYPILIKASAGGGGKGMRVVDDEASFDAQMKRAVSEAKSAFGDGTVFIEKYITSPRHIEFQILGDSQGNILHLFERECSVQRRHQKVVEEAPSAILNPELRDRMGAAAIGVAKACAYTGAGTVEFIVDEQRNFYFLEMNTRLQVEHPVTEMITGLDLVREQILIAEGHPLSFTQDQLEIHGHAIELRVYAEDPENNFLPDIGRLTTYERPTGPGVRVDDGFEQGMTIPIHYDPMIAKLVVHAGSRTLAIDRMIRAIEEYAINGVANTLEFGTFVMRHEAFRSGNFDTRFVEKYFNADREEQLPGHDLLEIAALMGAVVRNGETSEIPDNPARHTTSKWRSRAWNP